MLGNLGHEVALPWARPLGWVGLGAGLNPTYLALHAPDWAAMQPNLKLGVRRMQWAGLEKRKLHIACAAARRSRIERGVHLARQSQAKHAAAGRRGSALRSHPQSFSSAWKGIEPVCGRRACAHHADASGSHETKSACDKAGGNAKHGVTRPCAGRLAARKAAFPTHS